MPRQRRPDDVRAAREVHHRARAGDAGVDQLAGEHPRIVARQNLRLWHSLGAALYVVQWLCAAVVLWPLAGRRGDTCP